MREMYLVKYFLRTLCLPIDILCGLWYNTGILKECYKEARWAWILYTG